VRPSRPRAAFLNRPHWSFLDAGLVFVLLVASIWRLAFALRPPPFLTPDSQGYFLPGWELAHGLGFNPELRRTPAYPLFISLVVFLLGEDLRALTLAQHSLGVITAGLSYGLGRLAFGRLAGLVAGLTVGLSGPLLIYEHFVLTEALFTCLLALSALLALLALRQPSPCRLFSVGLALAAAVLTRPVAEVLLPALPLALLLRERAWRPVLGGSAFFVLGLASLLLPWMVRNALTHGSFSPEGALGQALIGRTVRHDDYTKFYSCPGDRIAGQTYDVLQIICQEAMGGEPSGGTISSRVSTELGLSQAETSRRLRQVAFEAIVGHADYYVMSSLRMARDILIGKRETVIAPWRERTTRNWDNKWDARLTPLVKTPPRPEGPEYERADALVNAFQPFRWRHQLALLLAIGVLAAAARPSWRPAVILPLTAAAVVLASAALDGDVWRYRYPVDPLLAVTIGGGVQAIWAAALWVTRRTSDVGHRLGLTVAAGKRWGQGRSGKPAERGPVVERRA
jgi:hypothetical protein